MSNAQIKFDLFDITFHVDDLDEFLANGLTTEEFTVTGDQFKAAITAGNFRVINSNSPDQDKTDTIARVTGEQYVSQGDKLAQMQATIDNLTSLLQSKSVISTADIAAMQTASVETDKSIDEIKG